MILKKSVNKNWLLCLCLCLALAVLCTVIYLQFLRPGDNTSQPDGEGGASALALENTLQPNANRQAKQTKDLAQQTDKADKKPPLASNLQGPQDPGATKNDAKNPAGDVSDKASDPFDYGRTPAVPANLNANTRSLFEARKTGKYPERLSTLVQPKPFDPAAYQKNAKAYLDVVEPGRAFQSAQPGKDVKAIRPLSPARLQVAQGQKVPLRVQAIPGMPVTFTSFDLGRFSENKLTTITVASDERGVAEVHFEGVSGTIENVNILVASPVTSGRVRYVVNVTLPDGERF